MQKRLLILDDDPVAAEVMRCSAEPLGFAVKMISAPELMTSLVRDWRPSHLVIDLVMPGTDGVEILRELAQFGCGAAIILTSALDIKILESARQSGLLRGLHVAGILPKPFQISLFRSLLDLAELSTASARSAKDPGRRHSSDEFRQALDDNQLQLHFQPKVRLADAQIEGFEALVRWNHPTDGLIYPGEFISLAEESGLMHSLTRQAIDLGLEWLGGLGRSSAYSMSMNISAVSFADQDFADHLYASCIKYGVVPERLTLEVTESTAVDHSAVVFDVFTRLRIKGFGLSIDDFETGYSALKQLAELPFSEIKIDRCFVSTMLNSQESMAIVESTIQLGKRLGLVTVAEGVEDRRTMHALQTLGCDLAQGYYFARPLSPDDAKRIIERWDRNSFA
jgi:EAL domain-containing protein (putative c-di-GMP-specific phosphodiesterase class I)